MTAKKSYNNPFQAITQGVSDLMKKKERIDGLKDRDNLDGKTVLITGASSGLGFATAIQMAQRGANLIMAVRSGIPEKGNEIIRLSKNKKVSMRFLDLSNFESIDDFISNLKKDKIEIDVFISNAAVVSLQSRVTEQGLDEMFMVNYLSVFYLTNKLLNKSIIKKNNARIIFVASESHRNPKEFNLQEFGLYKEFGFKETVSVYGVNKMYLVSFANELSRRKKNVYIRALCPGPVNTKIAREAPNILKPLLKAVFGLFFRAANVACEPVVFFAVEPAPKKGFDYLFLMSRIDIDEKTKNKENAKLLWAKSEKIINELNREI